MRDPVTADRVRHFVVVLGRETVSPTRLYLVGGATAVIYGWREATLDVDLRIEPDHELTSRLGALKDQLGINLELASPADFLPELPGWRERSPFLMRVGLLEVFHYDPYSQVLAKLERDLAFDRSDVRAMIDSGMVDPVRLAELLDEIWPDLARFPAVEAGPLRDAVTALGAADG